MCRSTRHKSVLVVVCGGCVGVQVRVCARLRHHGFSSAEEDMAEELEFRRRVARKLMTIAGIDASVAAELAFFASELAAAAAVELEPQLVPSAEPARLA